MREDRRMPDLADVRSLLADEHGLAVVSTVQRDHRVLSSVVNCGVLAHPATGIECVAFVSGGTAARLGHIRAGSDVTVTVRRGWNWVGVTGSAELIGPDDPVDGLDADGLRMLMRTVFQAAGGSHDDYDEYDHVMTQERRAAVFVTPARIFGNG
jgi:PPOX class probable F420-dependent enzyme